MDAIKMVKIELEGSVSKTMVDRWGGKKVYAELLYDILERYGNSAYFDPQLAEELKEDIK